MSLHVMQFLREQEQDLGRIHVEFRVASDERRADLDRTLDMWFGGARWRGTGHKFEILGTTWAGSMFCLWHYPELNDREPPVVFLGSDGEGLCVIATNAAAFIELLATGRVWGDKPGVFVDCDQPPGYLEFRRRACARFGFAPRTAEEIRTEALARHPDFESWVDMMMKE